MFDIDQSAIALNFWQPSFSSTTSNLFRCIVVALEFGRPFRAVSKANISNTNGFATNRVTEANCTEAD